MILPKDLYLMAVAAIVDTHREMDQPLMAVDGYNGEGTRAVMCVAFGDDAEALLQWMQRQGSMRVITLSPTSEDN